MSTLSRRTFVTTSLLSGAASIVRGADTPSETIVIGVMGVGGRGTSLAKTFAGLPNVRVAYVCDPDETRAGKAAELVAAASPSKPKMLADFRKILDDRSVDVLVCAACNHWHAPASILACAASKHVYVEKPCSHNPKEGELMVAAARKANRHVQMGNQRRSWPAVIEAISRLRQGEIGEVSFAQSWYTNQRPATGKGVVANPPAGLDYELWQGPAPRKPFKSNYLHYTWHWFWHWGNGELGNNGVHMIDVCRWGLGVDYPIFVSSAGGRFCYDDDQETPDTHVVSFTFPGGKMITWEGFSCNKLPREKPIDVLFLGSKGSLAISGGAYVIYDRAGKPVDQGSGRGGDLDHLSNFLAAVRGQAKLNSEIEEAHKSTLLCHLGNIAHRTGKSLHTDPKNGQILNDPEAMKLWSREYAPGWEPKV